jgi:hypothetical protein
MSTEDKRIKMIESCICEYIKNNEPDYFCTAAFLARQVLPTESCFYKQQIILKRMEIGRIAAVNKKWSVND